MNPLISVIVPVYKVEAYLRRAVDSVLNQSYQNTEIILVEDGSPDGCAVICDEYARQYSKVKVIHKENGGLSDARNAGLDVVLGEYIAFLDSDDYFAKDFIAILYEALVTTGSDVAFAPYQVVEREEPIELDRSAAGTSGVLTKSGEALVGTGEIPEEEVYCRKELLMNMYDANHPDATYFIVAWNKLYKASLWEGIRFPKGKIHEDEATLYKIFDRADKGVYVKIPLYAYFSAPSSITRTRFNMRRLDWLDALTDRIRYFEEKEEVATVPSALRARADGAIRYYYLLRKEVADSDKNQKQLKEYVKITLKRQRKYGKLPIMTRIGYRLFLLSPGLYRRCNRGVGYGQS